jgi:stage II sporulation protein M
MKIKKSVKVPVKKSTWVDLFKENFRESLSFSNKVRNYFLFSLFLFLAVFILGIFVPTFFQEQILDLIKNLIKQTEGLGPLELTGFIMFNNLKSAFFSMILGIFLGIFPFLVIIVNGYVLGFVAHSVIDLNGLLLWRILPHGVFEIPAIMIASGLGLYLGISWIRNCIVNSTSDRKWSKLQIYLLILLAILCFPVSFLILIVLTILRPEIRRLLWEDVKNISRVFIFIVIPLLVIAAIIEGWLIWVMG